MSLNHDMTKVLKCYVKRKSLGEIQFDEKQKESGVKICEHLIHEHSNKTNGKDKLKLITQISHVSDNCETPIPSTDRLAFTNKEESPDRIQQSPDLSNYFIKSLELSHIKSKSLDNDHDRHLHSNHKTIITTIVGDKSSNYERVHNTTFTHNSKGGNKIANGNSFTRPVASSNSSSNSRHESYYSLPSQIHRSQHVPSNEKLYQVSKKKFSTKKLWKKLFSSSKSQKKSEVNLKQIDKLAKLEVQSCMTPPFDHDDKIARQDSKKTTLVLNINQHLPFKSHKIGGKLEPLNKNKKKKKVPNFINSIITPQNLLFKSNRYSDHNNNIKNSSIHTIEADGPGNSAKVLVAELLATDGIEEFQYHINPDEPDCTDGNDDYNNVFVNGDSSVRQRSVSGNVSFSHYDAMMKEKERRTSCPTPQVSCNCNERKINLIVDILNLVILKQKELLNQKKMEIKTYDEELCHFIDCSIGKQVKGNGVSTLNDSWRQSQASLYSINSCLLCSKDLYPNITPLIKLLENDDEMECPIETIDYFVQASCYTHFEKGLKRTVGVNCTLKNVALLYYLTRRIVKHVGDPTDEDNKKIKKILKYSERFYQENYYPHIKNIHKSMESFLVSYNDNDNDDVD